MVASLQDDVQQYVSDTYTTQRLQQLVQQSNQFSPHAFNPLGMLVDNKSTQNNSGGNNVPYKFKVGDRVKIRTDSQYVYQSRNVGTVILIDSGTDYIYKVDFYGSINRYRAIDLDSADSQISKTVDFDSVILDAHKKQQIMDAIRQKDNHNLIFKEWGFGDVFEKGMAISLLFYGPPGTGKTLMGQAIADKYQYKLKVIGTAEVESSEPGQAERNIKAFFEEAQQDGKTVLLFDECDSLIYDRSHVGPILAAQVNCLLSCLESYEGIVIFTTNRLGMLDEAVNRRLSLKLEFDMPSADLRVDIWKRMFPKKAPLAKDVDFTQYAAVEIAGGYIKNVVLRAARMAANEDMPDKEKKIYHKHIVKALKAEVDSMIEFQNKQDKRGYHPSGGVHLDSGSGDYRKVRKMEKEAIEP